MRVLKDNYSSKKPANSSEYIEEKLAFSGFPKRTKLIRLRYVECEESISGRKSIIKTKEVPMHRLNIPENLSMADAIKTVSYVYDQVAKKIKAKHSYLLTSQLTDHCLKQFHFSEVSDAERKKEKCVDLFFVGKNDKLFISSPLYDSYVDWYVPEVSREEIKEAYNNIGLALPRSIKLNFEESSEPCEE